MCEASIYVPHRQARRQEHLVVRKIPSYSYMKGFYPAAPSDPTARDLAADANTLVCVVGERKVVTIKKVMIEPGAPNWVHEYEGMTNVSVMFVHRAYEDRIYFNTDPMKAGEYTTLNCFREGTLFDFGYAQPKPKEKKGMIVINRAIDEVMATEPKPGDEPTTNPEKPPAQQPADAPSSEPPPAPAKEPGPHPGPTSARRRVRA